MTDSLSAYAPCPSRAFILGPGFANVPPPPRSAMPPSPLAQPPIGGTVAVVGGISPMTQQQQQQQQQYQMMLATQQMAHMRLGGGIPQSPQQQQQYQLMMAQQQQQQQQLLMLQQQQQQFQRMLAVQAQQIAPPPPFSPPQKPSVPPQQQQRPMQQMQYAHMPMRHNISSPDMIALQKQQQLQQQQQQQQQQQPKKSMSPPQQSQSAFKQAVIHPRTQPAQLPRKTPSPVMQQSTTAFVRAPSPTPQAQAHGQFVVRPIPQTSAAPICMPVAAQPNTATAPLAFGGHRTRKSDGSLPSTTAAQTVTFSPEKLFFGTRSHKGGVDEELTDSFVIENGRSDAVTFAIAPVPLDMTKYSLVCTPTSGTIPSSGQVTVTAKLVVRCTTVIHATIDVSYQSAGCQQQQQSTSAAGTLRVPVTVETKLTTKLDWDELKVADSPIGRGANSAVFKGEWRGQPVAVKVLGQQAGKLTWELDKFEKEAELLDQLRSPYIVHFFGAVHEPGHLCLVTEYFPLGNLMTAMAAEKFHPALKAKIALDCAKAMRFIHASTIIHRDLKPANILVVSTSIKAAVSCKLGDFGTTRDLGSATGDDKELTKGVGTPSYMAPEVISGSDDYGFPSDIYSFAIVLWYIETEQVPYSEFKNAWAVSSFVVAGNRLGIPPSCPWSALIRSCWAQKPEHRPDFSHICESFELIFQKLNADRKAAKARAAVSATL